MAKQMSEGSKKVLNTLKGSYTAGKQWLTAELAEAAGVTPGVVTGSVTGLAKKGLAERIAGTIEVTVEKDGEMETVEKTVKYIKLTEAGYNFDPETIAE